MLNECTDRGMPTGIAKCRHQGVGHADTETLVFSSGKGNKILEN